MSRLILFIKSLDRKILLLAVGALLLLLNLFRLGWGAYTDLVEDTEANQALLSQYEATVSDLPNLKKRVTRQNQRSIQLAKYLFSGNSEEEVSSEMQIMLQEQVTKAGLEPESIRPMRTGKKNPVREYNEIEIKIRLAGTINQLTDFLAELYRSDKVFQIESFTMKPYKKDEMKIFLDMKGYYSLKNV